MNHKLLELRALAEVALARSTASHGLTTEDVHALSVALGALTVHDLPALPRPEHQEPAPPKGWREVPLFVGAGVHASLFVVPAGAALPLHDHPEMTVFLRTMVGRLRIRSFDWASDVGPGLAREIANIETTPDAPPCVLLPERGNLHAIESASEGDSVFLDLFAPYYDDALRPCTCYREIVGFEEQRQGERLVRLVAAPELDPEHGPERGPEHHEPPQSA